MRYWRVNQNQTFRHELAGGYLWSPKSNANGARNPFYESMREVSPGDVVFSFVDTRIAAIGVAQSYCWESPKPAEVGEAGQNWEDVGWKVKVAFTTVLNKVRPKDHIELLRAVLPFRYSPLQSNGNGIQSICLTEVPQDFAEVLASLIGRRGGTVHVGGGYRRTSLSIGYKRIPARPALHMTAELEFCETKEQHGRGWPEPRFFGLHCPETPATTRGGIIGE